MRHLPDLTSARTESYSKPVLELDRFTEAKLDQRRKTLEEVRTIEEDLDEMTRKANAAIRLS